MWKGVAPQIQLQDMDNDKMVNDVRDVKIYAKLIMI